MAGFGKVHGQLQNIAPIEPARICRVDVLALVALEILDVVKRISSSAIEAAAGYWQWP